jgi:hypothetical protein
VADEDDAHRGVDGRGRGARGDLEVDDGVEQPVAEAGDALAEVAAGLVLGVDYGLDGQLGQVGGNQAAEVLDEGIVPAKGGLIPLLEWSGW